MNSRDVLIGFVIAAAGAGLFWTVNGSRASELSRHGRGTLGRVDSLKPGQHRSVFYSFRVGPVEYAGSAQGGAGLGNPPFASLKPGTPVRVVYSPTNPQRSGLGDQQADTQNEAVFVGLVFLALWYAAIRVLRQRRTGQA